MMADGQAKDLADVGSGIGTHKQDGFSRFCQRNRRSTGRRGLPDAPLSGKKEKSWGIFKKFHFFSSSLR